MNKNQDKTLAVFGILGLLAAIYMLVANIFFSKNFSVIAVAAGFISPLLVLLTWNKGKR